jgi:hypothetical protein
MFDEINCATDASICPIADSANSHTNFVWRTAMLGPRAVAQRAAIRLTGFSSSGIVGALVFALVTSGAIAPSAPLSPAHLRLSIGSTPAASTAPHARESHDHAAGDGRRDPHRATPRYRRHPHSSACRASATSGAGTRSDIDGLSRGSNQQRCIFLRGLPVPRFKRMLVAVLKVL